MVPKLTTWAQTNVIGFDPLVSYLLSWHISIFLCVIIPVAAFLLKNIIDTIIIRINKLLDKFHTTEVRRGRVR